MTAQIMFGHPGPERDRWEAFKDQLNDLAVFRRIVFAQIRAKRSPREKLPMPLEEIARRTIAYQAAIDSIMRSVPCLMQSLDYWTLANEQIDEIKCALTHNPPRRPLDNA